MVREGDSQIQNLPMMESGLKWSEYIVESFTKGLFIYYVIQFEVLGRPP